MIRKHECRCQKDTSNQILNHDLILLNLVARGRFELPATAISERSSTTEIPGYGAPIEIRTQISGFVDRCPILLDDKRVLTFLHENRVDLPKHQFGEPNELPYTKVYFP